VLLQVFQTHVFKCFVCLETMLQVLYLDVSKVNRVFASLSSLSATSPWCLLLTFCCLASFSDYGGGAARAGEGVHWGPADGTRRGIAAQTQAHAVPFQDAEMVLLVGHDVSPQFSWLGTGRCVRTCCGCRTSGR